MALETGFQISVAQLIITETISELAKNVHLTENTDGAPRYRAFELAPPNFPTDVEKMEDVLPATPLQEGIIVESLVGLSNYMLFRLYRLRGITVDQLKHALQAVVKVRPLPRTTFASHGSSFLQVIQKRIDVPFKRIRGGIDKYLRHQQEAEPEALETPLICLASMDDDIVSIETHHALVDTWSYQYIQDDVRAALRGQELGYRPDFRFYIKHLTNKGHEPAHHFWKEYLQDAKPTVLETNDGAAFTAQIELSKDLFGQRQHHSSADAAILYASWAVILSVRTSADDVVFLVNISGRETPITDILTIQGPTMSTVPLRVRSEGSATIQQLTQRIVSQFWETSDHAHIGLKNILKAMGMSNALANTGANFLISLEEPSTDEGLEPLVVEYPNVRHLVTIEMDSKTPHCIKIFSSKGLVAADDILMAMKLIFETAIQEPQTTVNELRARLESVLHTNVTDSLSQEVFVGAHTEQAMSNQNTSSEPSSPRTDPVFDYHNEDSWNRPSPKTESVSTEQGEDLEPSSETWKKFMESCSPTVLESASTAHTTAHMSMPLVKLRAAAAKVNVSYEILITAAFGILLARHTETDPLFGLAVDGHSGVALADLKPSYFIPQRMSLPENATLQQVIRSVRIGTNSEHKHVRLLRIQQATKFTNYYSTLFDSLILFRSALNKGGPADAFPLDELGHPQSKTLQAVTDGQQLTMRFSGRLNQQRAHFLLEHMSHNIQAVISAPSANVRSLDLVSVTERSVLHELAQCDTPGPALIHSYFESFAAKTPDNQALELEGGESMTYKELNEHANRLARHLIQLGVVPNSFVPLYLDKSGDMIIAILAVLKAGATYVPLSPDNPAKRNQFVIEQVRASVIISRTQYAEFSLVHQAITVYTDRLPSIDHLEVSDTGIGDIDSIAYCLFTSGSTGTPKGVQVSHRAISIAVQGHLNAEKTTAATRHLLFANYMFDVSVHDIFSILGSGATLCVVSTKRLMSDLGTVMNEMRVTQTFFTPTVARLLSPSQVPTMETLLCDGEPLTTDIIDVWAKECTLINMYGPTELAVDVTYNWVNHKTKSTAPGRPPNTCSIMIVERNSLNLAPLGAIGELCVAGGHLADGYVSDTCSVHMAELIAAAEPG